MVAMTLPFRVRSDVDTFHTRRPGPRYEAVVDVKRALFVPLKIVGGLLLFAMSFAILGCHDLGRDGRPWLSIKDPACCAKTFPNFFDELDRLRQDSREQM